MRPKLLYPLRLLVPHRPVRSITVVESKRESREKEVSQKLELVCSPTPEIPLWGISTVFDESTQRVITALRSETTCLKLASECVVLRPRLERLVTGRSSRNIPLSSNLLLRSLDTVGRNRASFATPLEIQIQPRKSVCLITTLFVVSKKTCLSQTQRKSSFLTSSELLWSTSSFLLCTTYEPCLTSTRTESKIFHGRLVCIFNL